MRIRTAESYYYYLMAIANGRSRTSGVVRRWTAAVRSVRVCMGGTGAWDDAVLEQPREPGEPGPMRARVKHHLEVGGLQTRQQK